MTAVQTECTIKPQRPKGRPWKRLFGLVSVASIVIAAATYYGLGFSQSKFKAGLAALDRGDWPLARRYVRELKASQSSSPQGSFLQGAMLLEKGYYYPALDELDKAKQDALLESAALTLMGQAWYHLGRHAEAQAALLEALKQEPDSFDAHRWLAASYYDMGVIGDATHHLQRAAELEPNDPRPHRLLGLIHKDFGRFEEAIPFYQESLRRESDQRYAEEIKLELATCQVEHRQYGDALATLANSSDLAEFDVLRARCYYAQGDATAAKAALDRALKKKGDNLDGLILRGDMLLEEGNAQAAIEAFQRAVKAQPNDYGAHFKLSQAYRRANEQQLAGAEQKEAERIRVIRDEFSLLHKTAAEHPRDINVRLRLAFLARELGRPELAEVWMRSAAALQSFSESDSN